LLSAEKWTEAASLRDQFAAAMNGAVRGVSEWQHQVDDLASAAVVAEQTALEKAFEGTRLAAVEALQDGALAAVERMDFAAAVASLEQAAADCAHPGLAQAIAARSELFTSAQRAMEQVFARLNAAEQIQITEPIGGKRAYATEANPDGVTIMIQVNGKRVARTDPAIARPYSCSLLRHLWRVTFRLGGRLHHQPLPPTMSSWPSVVGLMSCKRRKPWRSQCNPNGWPCSRCLSSAKR